MHHYSDAYKHSTTNRYSCNLSKPIRTPLAAVKIGALLQALSL